MSKRSWTRELCRRLGHDWRVVGIYLQCRTCLITVSHSYSDPPIEHQLRIKETAR